jgi:hypothetical protein
MKTLVIHPNDPTTSFLDVVYNETDWTIFNDNVVYDQEEFIKLLESHERIIMMGHGTPNGLLGNRCFIIGHFHASILQKKEVVCMWCNAHAYFCNYGLKGFFTGMIISEEIEADYLGIQYKSGDVDESNVLFTKALKESIQNTPKVMCDKMKEIYVPSEGNKVMEYNAKRLYYFDK